MSQQQQQQFADYDLLAVFNDDTQAQAAESKLLKEGFGNDEVFRLASSMIREGEFREHGPNRDRGALFLQTRRAGPSPAMVVLLAILCGLLLGLLLFVAHFAFAAVPEPPAAIAGVVVGVIVGAVIGLLRPGRMQGAIGQDTAKAHATERQPTQGDLKVVALRLPDAENVARKSRARAILLTNGGKIDRSVGRREQS
jgi:hypothetical protein